MSIEQIAICRLNISACQPNKHWNIFTFWINISMVCALRTADSVQCSPFTSVFRDFPLDCVHVEILEQSLKTENSQKHNRSDGVRVRKPAILWTLQHFSVCTVSLTLSFTTLLPHFLRKRKSDGSPSVITSSRDFFYLSCVRCSASRKDIYFVQTSFSHQNRIWTGSMNAQCTMRALISLWSTQLCNSLLSANAKQ